MNDPQVIHDQAVDVPTRVQNALEQQRLLDDPARPELPFEKAQRLLFAAVDELEQATGELLARGLIFEPRAVTDFDPNLDLNPVAQPHTDVTRRVRAVTLLLRGTSPTG